MDAQEIFNDSTHKAEPTLDKQLCRDYIRGTCSRTKCKFSHNIQIQKSQPPTNKFTTKPILGQLYIPGKGHIFININNFALQQNYNGIFICNLNDIIPTTTFEHLMNIGSPDQAANEYIINSVQSGCIMWTNTIIKIIKWAKHSLATFDKTNYKLVFVYDVNEITNNWILKQTKKNQTNNSHLISYIQYYINTLFTILINKLPVDISNEMNIIVNYLQDEFSICNRYLIDFLANMIVSVPNKYISNTFYQNLYYIGKKPNFEHSISANVNKGFIFSYITGCKYIDMNDILLDNQIIYTGNTEIYDLIMEYSTQLTKHNFKIHEYLFDKNTTLRETILSKIRGSLKPRSKSLVVIGCNLDVDFDKYVLVGLKEVIGSINFAAVLGSKPIIPVSETKNTPNTKNITNNPATKLATNSQNTCCDDNTVSTTNMSIIVPIFSGEEGDDISQINNIVQNLLANTVSNKLLENKVKSELVYNKICTIGLNLITDIKGNTCINQPFDTILGIEKIKEYGANPDNKIILICSPKLNHKVFEKFIHQITRTPGYPVKITSSFIDYDINPGMRLCLAYNLYRNMISEYYKPISTEKIPISQISKLWRRFTNYINIIKPETNQIHKSTIGNIPQCVSSQNIATEALDTPKDSSTDSSTDSHCCTCCACLSRNGVGYIKIGNIPYIPMEQLESTLKNDSWLPRF